MQQQLVSLLLDIALHLLSASNITKRTAKPHTSHENFSKFCCRREINHWSSILHFQAHELTAEPHVHCTRMHLKSKPASISDYFSSWRLKKESKYSLPRFTKSFSYFLHKTALCTSLSVWRGNNEPHSGHNRSNICIAGFIFIIGE